MRLFFAALAAFLISGGSALADPVEGNWRVENGNTVQIYSCGNAFCIKIKTGQFAGKNIGKVTARGNNRYTGQITDPEDNKTYSGKARLVGSTLKMSGCVLGGLLCKSQNWSKL